MKRWRVPYRFDDSEYGTDSMDVYAETHTEAEDMARAILKERGIDARVLLAYEVTADAA